MTGSNTKLQGLKVLVIDDSKTIRRTAETLLAKEGCEVFTAIDGSFPPNPLANSEPMAKSVGSAGLLIAVRLMWSAV